MKQMKLDILRPEYAETALFPVKKDATLPDREEKTESPVSALLPQMSLTGDPFVDVGGLVMETIPQRAREDKIRRATDIYVDLWKGKVDSIFLLSKLNNNHVKNKPEAQRIGALEYYLGALKGEGSVMKGYCRVCASKGDLFEAGRNNFPLVGSGEFVNYHHFQEPALFICKDCLVKLYFMPLGVLQSGGNLMLLQFQSKEQEKLWQEDVVQTNLDKAVRGTSEGILKSDFLNPQNALFYMASRLIERFELYDRPFQRIRLFCFTNFGPKPDVTIHDLPNRVFSFLKRVLKADLKPDWMYFVKRHYFFSKSRSVHFDEKSQEWIEVKAKTSRTLEPMEYIGKNSNRIYNCLLGGKSILGCLRNIHKSRKFQILIAITYLKEVRKMRQEQIDLIRNIADKIILLSQKAGNDYKKFITPVEGARYAYQLRNAIIRMVKTYYKNGESDPFVRLKDYAEYLFPDGQNWNEVRDLLLICLYEKLHDLRIEPTEISDEDVADIEETGADVIDSFND